MVHTTLEADCPLPPPPFCLCLIGERNSGKTNLLINLCIQPKAWYGKFDKVILWSPSYGHDEQLELVRWDEVHPDFDEEVLAHMYDEKAQLRPWTRELWVFDDNASEKSFHDSPTLAKVAIRGRHVNISTVMLSQTVMRVNKAVRINAEALIAFFTGNEPMQKELYRDFCNGYNKRHLTFREFRQIFQWCTQDPYSFMYVYKAKKDKRFTIYRQFDPVWINFGDDDEDGRGWW